MKEEMQLVHLRVPSRLVKALDHYAIDRNLYRAEALAELLDMVFSDLKFATEEAKHESRS